MVSSAERRDELDMHDAQLAMRISLLMGVAMLLGKTLAFYLTHSVAVFSDAAESVIHVIAVGFASFSLRLSAKPASLHFLYGYERDHDSLRIDSRVDCRVAIATSGRWGTVDSGGRNP